MLSGVKQISGSTHTSATPTGPNLAVTGITESIYIRSHCSAVCVFLSLLPSVLIYRKYVMSAKLLVPLVGVGTVLRLEMDGQWSNY